ncbi:MAG: hydrogenase iron-sulfur subunit, partial [Desulfobacteraceae bacterium]
NCHSEDGNIFVRHRVEQLKETFSQMNFDKERLEIKTLASNMGYEFAQLTDNFEKTLNKLSSSNLKKGKE